MLLASVRRHLGAEVADAVFLWRTGRLTVPFALAATLVCAALAAALGFHWPTGVVAIGLVGGAVAWVAGTEYRVLAVQADGEMRLLRGSRIRQTAVAVLDDRIDRNSIRPLSVSPVVSHWRVGGHEYTLHRRYQRRIATMAGGAPSSPRGGDAGPASDGGR
ncbi:MAG: hypothetical protein AAF962_17955 [Actinomycetota bacterium]